MKRLPLLSLTLMLALGCQRSNSDPESITLPPGIDDEEASVTRLTSCHEADEWICAVEAAIIEKTNQKRAGLPILKQSYETSYAARVHSLDMMSRRKADHRGFAEGHRQETLNQEFPGLKVTFAAENVAWLSQNMANPDLVAEEFVNMWWKSAGHRNNMLGARHRSVGVGVARSDERGIYVTQIFH